MTYSIPSGNGALLNAASLSTSYPLPFNNQHQRKNYSNMSLIGRRRAGHQGPTNYEEVLELFGDIVAQHLEPQLALLSLMKEYTIDASCLRRLAGL